MMDDDLVSSLTRQVKEEVIQNYLLERRLIDLQIEHLQGQAEQSRIHAWITGRRLTRLAYLMIDPQMRQRLREVLDIAPGNFWTACLDEKFQRRIPLIRVRALTQRSRFRKLVVESYSRLHKWMDKYRGHYLDLAGEIRAVNSNIEIFRKNFDLLTILAFLRNLDLQGIEKKKILGENFTAKEMAELDKNLYIKPVSLENFAAPPPIDLPEPRRVEEKLIALADEVFLKYEHKVRKILR
jgi:hypothetical protein